MQALKNKYRLILILALALAGGWILFGQHTAKAEIQTGQPAPVFAAVTTAGQPITNKDLLGKVVVMEWNNHECPFVKKFYSIGKMQELQKTYTAKGVVWITVNSSAPGKQGHVDTARANALTQELGAVPSHKILDGDGAIGRSFGAKTTPHMFIIDKNGILVYQGAIDDNNSTDSADIASAKNYVVAALDEVLGGKPVSISSTRPYGCSVKY